MFADVKVGDVLYAVKGHGREHEITVTKVGHKWAQFGPRTNDRFDKSTGLIDGGKMYDSSGRVYRNQLEYCNRRLDSAIWEEFKRQVRSMLNMREGVSIDNVVQAAEFLGVDLMSEESVAKWVKKVDEVKGKENE